MSAISIVWNHGSEPPANFLPSMLTAQSQYGVDRSFSWTGQHISLGGCISSFLPEDRFDSQPIWSADRSSCLVADVRLDNRADLARSLGLVHPEGLADSSFLMSAWLRWGASCVDYILGGFAFAVWTPSRSELFAARDHAGERPLFYYRLKDLFAAASMPKGLLALPGVFRGFDEARLADWLGCVQPVWTTSNFAGIERVPPGHLLRITPDSFECKQYWHPSKAPPARYKRDEDYAQALLEIFDQATEARLRSTKAIGVQLSAGLDSSSVAASAARILAAQGKQLTAFTAVPRPQFNNVSEPWQLPSEGPAASEVARMYPNVGHVLVDSSGYDLLKTMKLWTDAMDEPALNVVNFLWTSAILDRARQRGIGVMLEGASGNGTISWETWAILGHLFRRGRWFKLLNTTRSLRRHGDISLRAAARASIGGLLPGWFNQLLLPGDRQQNSYAPLANPKLIRKYALVDRMFENTYGDVSSLDEEHARLFEAFDFGSIHAATQSIAQMDVRDPTSDKRIYDFCFSIPREQYIVGGHSRSLVRRAMKDRLPQSTLQRYTRGYQGADWYLSIAEALPSLRRETALIEKSPVALQTVDLPRMRDLLDTWPDSGYHTNQVSLLWLDALTRGISMGYFLRSHDAAAGTPSPSDPLVQDSPVVPASSVSRLN